MAQLTGIAFIKVDGVMLQTKPGAKLKLGGKKREPKIGHKVYGYTETTEQAELDCTAYHSAAMDVEALRNATASVILFETDTGVTFQISNAFLLETLELTDGEGEISMKFAGDPAEQQ